MKSLLTLILVLGCALAGAQIPPQEFGMNYNYSQPWGSMGSVIQRAHGLSMNYGFVFPKTGLVAGLDLNWGQYGRDKSRQQYAFEDGSVADMDIIVANSFGSLMAYTRWYPGRNGESLLHPFLTAKAGYSFYGTRLNIYDPDDADRCEPVDSESLYKDGTPTVSLGAGMKVDFAKLFRNMRRDMLFFETSVNVVYGGEVRYMHTDGPAPHHGTVANHDRLMAQFRNIDTQVIHEHHVGYVYRSRVQMMELRFGVSMRLGE